MASGERFVSVSYECLQKMMKAYNETVMEFCGGKYDITSCSPPQKSIIVKYSPEPKSIPVY